MNDFQNNELWRPRLSGHHAAWLDALGRGLGHPTHRLQVHRAGRVVAELPLALVQSRLFGKFLVSLPYLNTGGVWSEDEASASQLIDQAIRLADQENVKYLELRHELPISHPALNAERTDKVHMRLALPKSSAELMAGFKSKLRSQVRKAEQYELSVHWGQHELLREFYMVFARNMRDLGTPVYSDHLFQTILDSFAGNAELCVIRQKKRPIAAALLIHGDRIAEVPSASSLRESNSTNANMWMYWHLLCRAIDRGAAVFDFGRSSPDSGTYRFKAQWGAEPFPCHWQFYVRAGNPADMRPDSAGNQRLIEIWKQLPLWFTKVIGPRIVRGIP